MLCSLACARYVCAQHLKLLSAWCCSVCEVQLCPRVFLFRVRGAARGDSFSGATGAAPSAPSLRRVVPRSARTSASTLCLEIPSLAPRQADLTYNHEPGTLAADLCSRSPCSSTLLHGVVSSARQGDLIQHATGSHTLRPHATELGLPGLPQGLLSSVLLEFLKRVSSSVLLLSLSETVFSFQRMLHASPLLPFSSNSCPQSDADA